MLQSQRGEIVRDGATPAGPLPRRVGVGGERKKSCRQPLLLRRLTRITYKSTMVNDGLSRLVARPPNGQSANKNTWLTDADRDPLACFATGAHARI